MTEIQTIAVDATRAAQRLGIGERRFHQLRKEPGFPEGRRVGPRQVRWLICELDAWLAARPPAGAKPEPEQLARSRVFRAGVEQREPATA